MSASWWDMHQAAEDLRFREAMHARAQGAPAEALPTSQQANDPWHLSEPPDDIHADQRECQ